MFLNPLVLLFFSKYWGVANTLWPPNQIIGGAMAPYPPPPIVPPMYRRHGVLLFSHLAESTSEINQCASIYKAFMKLFAAGTGCNAVLVIT